MRIFSRLSRVIGYGALLLHGDPLVLDRWLWLRRRLPRSGRLVDVGCGNGAFTMAAAARGLAAVGLTWDEHDLAQATQRARRLGLDSARFEAQDVRSLDARDDLVEAFDVAICLENIEHVLDDERLMRAIAGTLRPTGRLLLTTPNEDYRPIDASHAGPFHPIEDGRHVRKGYRTGDLEDLCARAGLSVIETSSCSGFFSQKVAGVLWRLQQRSRVGGWIAVLPLRVLPAFDGLVRRFASWPDYSVCVVAEKPGAVDG